MQRIVKISLVFFLTLFILSSAEKAHAAPPVDFQTTQIIGSGLTNPTGLEIAPDGRIFILQQKGQVRIYKNGQLLATPFATLPVSQAGGDLGLLGVAFDPAFASNHYVYFYYTSSTGVNTVARYDATNDTATGSPYVLYESFIIAQQFHAGGTIAFGPDGKLYISIGDNQYPPDAQSLNNPAGKILRINKDGSIPSDNPFVGQSGKIPEIWAYGLRNPFRFQFDKASGRLYVGDVGQDGQEEVNLIIKGGNYGWPTCEGVCNVAGLINPVYAYPHNGLSSSITGGLVYNGSVFPSFYQGSYIFADYAQGFMQTLTLNASGGVSGSTTFDPSAGSVVDLKEAPDGSIYYLTIFPGRLYQTTYTVANHIPVAKSSADVTEGLDPLTVHFSSAGSIDSDGTPITYSWDFGDGTTSINPNPTKVFNNPGRYTVLLTVSDGVNQAQAAPIIIQAGTPPTITIASPINNATYKAGDTISYVASAKDSDNNTLPADAFRTEVLFHHSTHQHPFMLLEDTNQGNFSVPTTGETASDVYYEIKFTVTDGDGLSTSKSVTILPLKSNLTFVTNPPNLKILLDSEEVVTPDTIESVVGLQRELNTPSMQNLNGTYYQFDSWSVGGSQRHYFATPANNATITANFKTTSAFNTEYWNNVNLSGLPSLTRNEGPIDHDFGSGSPAQGINSDNFSIRYTKQYAFSEGLYKFDTLSDDGVRLYIDGILIIDKWIDQPATPYSGNAQMTAGDHEIKLEYYDRGGGALVKLTWELLGTPLPTPTGAETPTPTPSPASPTGQTITSFSLINADTDQVIATFDPLTDGATLNLATLPTTHLNVRANTNPATIGSVRFAYDGNSNFQTESYAPYALASDDNGNYFPWTPTNGSHTISATPYTGQLGGGSPGTPLSITIDVTQGAAPTATPTVSPAGPTSTPTPTPLSGQSVTSYSLINADTDQVIPAFNPIPEGATINITTLPTQNINIRANTNPATVGSVKFAYDANPSFRTESYTPYALASDENGDYFPWTPTLGAHTVVATPFTQQNAGGTQGTPLTLHFTITDSATTPTPSPTSAPTSPVTPTLSPTPTVTPIPTITPAGPTPTPTGQYVQSLTLINADTDQPIAAFDPIPENAIIKLSTLATNHLNIRANTHPAIVGSLKFSYDAQTNFQLENVAPYAFVGDEFGNYAPWIPSLGDHTIIATPYAGENATGTVGTSLTRNFTIEP
jgi:glucose/arabinose dehydrogenase